MFGFAWSASRTNFSVEADAVIVHRLVEKLILRRGSALKEIPKLSAEMGVRSVYWNRCYEPFAIERDKKLKEKLSKAGIEANSAASLD